MKLKKAVPNTGKSLWTRNFSERGEVDKTDVPPLFTTYDRVQHIKEILEKENNHKKSIKLLLNRVLEALAMYDEVGCRYHNFQEGFYSS